MYWLHMFLETMFPSCFMCAQLTWISFTFMDWLYVCLETSYVLLYSHMRDTEMFLLHVLISCAYWDFVSKLLYVGIMDSEMFYLHELTLCVFWDYFYLLLYTRMRDTEIVLPHVLTSCVRWDLSSVLLYVCIMDIEIFHLHELTLVFILSSFSFNHSSHTFFLVHFLIVRVITFVILSLSLMTLLPRTITVFL